MTLTTELDEPHTDPALCSHPAHRREMPPRPAAYPLVRTNVLDGPGRQLISEWDRLSRKRTTIDTITSWGLFGHDIAELDDGGAKAKREAQKIKYWLMNFDRMLPEVQAGVVPNARDVHTGAMATILKELDEYTYDADYANRPEAHPRFEWYMAWGDYQTRMVQNGIMWYSPQLKPVLGQLPPDAVPPPPAPPQQPQQSAPAVDAYGQPQGEQPQQPNTLLTPDVMAQYQMAQQQMGARGMDNTQQPNEAQPAGPGVGGLDTIASR